MLPDAENIAKRKFVTDKIKEMLVRNIDSVRYLPEDLHDDVALVGSGLGLDSTFIEAPEFSEKGNKERSEKVYRYVFEKKEEYHALTTLTLNGVNFNQRLLERLQVLTLRQIEDGVKRSGYPCRPEAAVFFSHLMASGELAELEIIANGLLTQEQLARFQKEAALLNSALLQKIRAL